MCVIEEESHSVKVEFDQTEFGRAETEGHSSRREVRACERSKQWREVVVTEGKNSECIHSVVSKYTVCIFRIPLYSVCARAYI
jgi:hypothetical protein